MKFRDSECTDHSLSDAPQSVQYLLDRLWAPNVLEQRT